MFCLLVFACNSSNTNEKKERLNYSNIKFYIVHIENDLPEIGNSYRFKHDFFDSIDSAVLIESINVTNLSLNLKTKINFEDVELLSEKHTNLKELRVYCKDTVFNRLFLYNYLIKMNDKFSKNLLEPYYKFIDTLNIKIDKSLVLLKYYDSLPKNDNVKKLQNAEEKYYQMLLESKAEFNISVAGLPDNLIKIVSKPNFVSE